MTNDRFIDWLQGEGYDFDPIDDDWIHRDGRTVIDRESSAGALVDGTLLLRDRPAKLKGLSAALKSDGFQDFQQDLTNAYEVAKADLEEVDTLRELRDFNVDDIIRKAEGDLPSGRKKYFDLIRDDIENLAENLDVPVIEEIAEELRKVTSVEDLKSVQERLKDIKEKEKVEKIVAITGIQGPDVVIVKRPKKTSAFGKAQERIRRAEARQTEARGLSADFIEGSKQSTVSSFADFWGWDPKSSDDLEEVRQLLIGKGFKIDVKPSGQERFEHVPGIFG